MSEQSASGVYGSERVRHFAFQCGEVYKRSMIGLLHNVVQMRRVDPRLADCDDLVLRRYALESLKEWPQSTRDEEAQVALRDHPEMEANYKFSFVIYARNFYGTDQYGNRNALDLRIPPFSYFLFELFCNGLEDPKIIFEEFYEDHSYWKFTKALVRKTLCEVSKGRVSLQTDPRTGPVTRVGGGESTNYANPAVAVSEEKPSDNSSSDTDSEEERRRRRRRRERRERRHGDHRSNGDRRSRPRSRHHEHRPSRGSQVEASPTPSFLTSSGSGDIPRSTLFPVSAMRPPEPSLQGGPPEPSDKVLTLDGGSNEMPPRSQDGSYEGMGPPPAHSESDDDSGRSTQSSEY